MTGAFINIRTDQLAGLPIHTIDFTKPDEVRQHDHMLDLHKPAPATPQKQERLQREIDALVYALYGLTDEEISIVESG